MKRSESCMSMNLAYILTNEHCDENEDHRVDTEPDNDNKLIVLLFIIIRFRLHPTYERKNLLIKDQLSK